MAKPLHLQFYDQIGSDMWSGEGTTAKAIAAQLAANADASEIVLHINSPGGSVYEGYTIYNLLKASGKKITAKIEGYCASIATLIALSAEDIEMLPLAQWLIHNPFTFIEGNSEDLLQAAEELKRIESVLVGVYVARTGRSEDEIRALMDEDKFINAQEAVDMGFATRVSEPIKAVAFYNSPLNTITNHKTEIMSETKKLSKWQQLANFIASIGGEDEEGSPAASNETPEPKATTQELEGGGNIYFEGTLEEGTLVFTDEAMEVVAADGDHVLADGRTITVANGAVTAITEPAPANNAELEAAQARISELENQLAGFQNTINALKAQNRKAATATPAQNFAGDTPAPSKLSKEKEAFTALKRN